VHILFNFKNNTGVYNKAKDVLIDFTKSIIDNDVKLKYDLVIEIYKKIKRNNKNSRTPNDLFDIISSIKFNNLNDDAADEEEKMDSLELKRKRQEDA